MSLVALHVFGPVLAQFELQTQSSGTTEAQLVERVSSLHLPKVRVRPARHCVSSCFLSSLKKKKNILKLKNIKTSKFCCFENGFQIFKTHNLSPDPVDFVFHLVWRVRHKFCSYSVINQIIGLIKGLTWGCPRMSRDFCANPPKLTCWWWKIGCQESSTPPSVFAVFLPSVLWRVGNETQKSAFLTNSVFNGAFRCICVILGYVNQQGHDGV